MAEVPREELNTVVFMGSAKTVVAPWGGPARLGTRVLEYVKKALNDRKEVKHNVTVLDPIELKLPVLEGPAFYYKAEDCPQQLADLDKIVAAADCYVIVTAEYNHCIPPGLTNLMSHFGGSKYKNKASAICCYSSGQYGGMRAAMQVRALTGELGCISTSNILGVPSAQKEFNDAGVPNDPDAWARRFGRFIEQLEFAALAFKDRKLKEEAMKQAEGTKRSEK